MPRTPSKLSVLSPSQLFRYGRPVWQHAAWRLAEPDALDTSSPPEIDTSNQPASDYDSPWKDALELYFEQALKLLVPELHARIDWTRPIVFLDKEFQAISHQLSNGRKHVDKLVQVYGRDGSPMVILVHVEVQSDPATLLQLARMAERMTFYMFRIRDGFRHGRGKVRRVSKKCKSGRSAEPGGGDPWNGESNGVPIAALTSLSDDAQCADGKYSANSNDDLANIHSANTGDPALFSLAIFTNSVSGPSVLRHEWEFLGCKSSFECPAIHLGQWWERWGELEAQARTNPFAAVIMAQLLAHKYQDKPRLVHKLQLIRLLYQYGYGRDAILSVLRFITWMLRLPPELEPAFEQGLQDIEQEYNMPYIMSFERNALAKGQAIGEELGEKRGEARGEKRGEVKAMHAMLQRLLTLKFGVLPDWADIRLKQADAEMLASWSERVLFVDTLEGVFKAGN